MPEKEYLKYSNGQKAEQSLKKVNYLFSMLHKLYEGASGHNESTKRNIKNMDNAYSGKDEYALNIEPTKRDSKTISLVSRPEGESLSLPGDDKDDKHDKHGREDSLFKYYNQKMSQDYLNNRAYGLQYKNNIYNNDSFIKDYTLKHQELLIMPSDKNNIIDKSEMLEKYIEPKKYIKAEQDMEPKRHVVKGQHIKPKKHIREEPDIKPKKYIRQGQYIKPHNGGEIADPGISDSIRSVKQRQPERNKLIGLNILDRNGRKESDNMKSIKTLDPNYHERYPVYNLYNKTGIYDSKTNNLEKDIINKDLYLKENQRVFERTLHSHDESAINVPIPGYDDTDAKKTVQMKDRSHKGMESMDNGRHNAENAKSDSTRIKGDITINMTNNTNINSEMDEMRFYDNIAEMLKEVMMSSGEGVY